MIYFILVEQILTIIDHFHQKWPDINQNWSIFNPKYPILIKNGTIVIEILNWNPILSMDFKMNIYQSPISSLEYELKS